MTVEVSQHWNVLSPGLERLCFCWLSTFSVAFGINRPLIFYLTLRERTKFSDPVTLELLSFFRRGEPTANGVECRSLNFLPSEWLVFPPKKCVISSGYSVETTTD